MTEVAQWARFEAQFTSFADYENPVQDVRVEVDFTSPNGKKQTRLGFWDGGRMWKVRFSPDETGKWTYHSRCLQEEDAGLNNQVGEFNCVQYSAGRMPALPGDNPLYRHGAIRVSENRRYLAHSDGTPFFWLGDTAWNGVLMSDEESWRRYLQDRAAKGFTVVQFIATQWKAGPSDADGRLAFAGKDRIQINPAFYKKMDQRMNALNEYGIMGAPVLLWATRPGPDPGLTLPDDQLIVLAGYMVARYGSHHVTWILGGDGDYLGEKAEKWKKIGRAVFGVYSGGSLATMHPRGRQWVADEFRDETWFSFNGYQSGHRGDDSGFRWHCEGPPGQGWKREPHHPVINLEPNYEAHRNRARGSEEVFDAHAVRRAAYWSLLVSPPAGVTYGAHGIWSWQLKPEEPMEHRGTGIASPWHEAIGLPGSTSMRHLKRLLSSVEWWRLFPAQELLVEQPGASDPRKFAAVAKAEDETWALAYLPEGITITLRKELLGKCAVFRWFNPRTGEWSDAHQSRVAEYEEVGMEEATQSFTAPDSSDWVLWIGTRQ